MMSQVDFADLRARLEVEKASERPTRGDYLALISDMEWCLDEIERLRRPRVPLREREGSPA